MIITTLLLVIGIPAILALAATAWKRSRKLAARIAEVQQEMARDPRPPYAALAELLQEQQQRQHKGK